MIRGYGSPAQKSSYCLGSAPAESRSDVFQDRLDHMGAIIHAELVGDGEEQRVGFGNCFVLTQLFNENFWLGGVGAAEDSARTGFNITELIAAAVAAEIHAIAVIDQREDAAADRDAWFVLVASFLPGLTKDTDLLGLLDVERLAAFVEFEGGALQVHAELCCPLRSTVRGSTPPDAFAQARRVRFQAQQAGRIGKHGLRVRLGEAFSAQDIKQ